MTMERSGVRSSREFHKRLMTALQFPDLEMEKWDALWDAVTGSAAFRFCLMSRG